MMQSLRNPLRLLRLLWILARYNALTPFTTFAFVGSVSLLLKPFKKFGLPKRPGKRLALALTAIGPTYIKLGQTLSTRPDIVGSDLADDLAGLRDNLPSFPAIKAQRIIEDAFGDDIDTFYAQFDEVPVAAASIAQVHFAVTAAGKEVAVKILRPGIEAAFKRDITLLEWLAQKIEKRLPHLRRLKPIEVIAMFRESVAYELDLRFEAASATELKSNMASDTGFTVPAVHWDLTSQRVLTLDRITGIPIHDVEALKTAGHKLDAVLEKASTAFFNQVFVHGFFHADMHPGNIFVESTGNVAVVDFGIMGRMDMKSRLYIAEILYGFLKEDYTRVADAHFAAGYVPSHKSREQFALACMAIAKPILGKPVNEISVGGLLGQLFQVTETFEMETQPQLLLLQKTLVVVEGLGRMLNPSVNMWQLAEPPITAWAKDNLSPQAKLRMGAKELAEHLRKLPAMLELIEAALKKYLSETSPPAGNS